MPPSDSRNLVDLFTTTELDLDHHFNNIPDGVPLTFEFTHEPVVLLDVPLHVLFEQADCEKITDELGNITEFDFVLGPDLPHQLTGDFIEQLAYTGEINHLAVQTTHTYAREPGPQPRTGKRHDPHHYSKPLKPGRR